MQPNQIIMKLLSLLTSATLLTSVAFWTALALDVGAISFFGLATAATVLLLAVSDYYPQRRQLSLTVSRRAPARRAKYALPMAA